MSLPTRILHLNDGLETGGVERVVVNLATEFSRRSSTVGVLAAKGGALWGALPATVRRIELEPRTRLWSTLHYARAIRKTVRSENWQILHAHQRGLALVARVATVGLPVRVVEHVHSTFKPTGAKKFLSFRGHHVIACGSAGGRMIVSDFGRPLSRVSVVTNAVSDPGADNITSLPTAVGQAPHLIAVGRLSEEKDPVRFVDIVREVQKWVPACTARWVGDGPLRDCVEEHLTNCNVSGVWLDGSSNEVDALIQKSDLLLMSSKIEGLPLVVLESMALGRPVVVPDVGSLRDVVDDGRTGIVFGCEESPHQTAERIIEMLGEGSQHDMGHAARAKFEAIGSIVAMADAIEAVYARVVQT